MRLKVTDGSYEPFLVALNSIKDRIIQEEGYAESGDVFAEIEAQTYRLEVRKYRPQHYRLLGIDHKRAITLTTALIFQLGAVLSEGAKLLIEIHMPDNSYRWMVLERRA